MSIEDHIAALRENRFQFDCASMELVQARDSVPTTFRGMGFVEQDKEGQLSFKLYTATFENTDPASQLQAQMNAKAGQLYALEDYYDLTVVAIDGTVWTASRILPKCIWNTDLPPIITGTMYSIHTPGLPTKNNIYSLSVHIFEDLKLPIGQNQAGSVFKFTAASCEFEITKTGFGVLVKASSQQPLQDDLELRIQEALKFFTAKPAIIRTTNKVGIKDAFWELMSAPKDTTQSRMYPPLLSSQSCFYADGPTLFHKYLEFVINNSPTEHWSHVTYHVHNATEASANSIDALAVGVSVAVEGLANLIPKSTNVSNKKLIKELREWTMTQIKKESKFSGLYDRLDGLLNSMHNPRVQDALNELKASGRVTSDYAKAWTKLRNQHVHPEGKDLKKLPEDNIQDLLNLTHKVTTLMYEIVFHLIDYSGQYQDFGTHDFPTKTYPQKVKSVDNLN